MRALLYDPDAPGGLMRAGRAVLRASGQVVLSGPVGG